MTRPIRLFLSVVLFLFVSLGSAFEVGRMRVHCINVGQGSATLLEFKCGAMLVDTGAGSTQDVDHLISYLEWFFNLRPDLNRTLKVMALTHSHKDHALGLLPLAEKFTVERFLFNGDVVGSGASSLNKILRAVRDGDIATVVRIVDDHRVTTQGTADGYTDADVDPLTCDDCDPRVHVLASSMRVNPGWPVSEFENQNNHSMVFRIALGASSLLITGDAEEHELELLEMRYLSGGPLDSDILVVGHHGSRNATTQSFLDAVTPKAALISCGKWNEGEGSSNPFTTWRYGHPNVGILDLLQGAISSTRPRITVKAGIKSKVFTDYTVRKRIYCTAWDGSVVVDAYESGTIYVRRNVGM
ncbi:MAG: MBL fold metallo-hydrolase [Fimbriimonadaceae bacterium]|nr:MBL fold metallo-hydrolase [Fimbriimonadaceae bacterium]